MKNTSVNMTILAALVVFFGMASLATAEPTMTLKRAPINTKAVINAYTDWLARAKPDTFDLSIIDITKGPGQCQSQPTNPDYYCYPSIVVNFSSASTKETFAKYPPPTRPIPVDKLKVSVTWIISYFDMDKQQDVTIIKTLPNQPIWMTSGTLYPQNYMFINHQVRWRISSGITVTATVNDPGFFWKDANPANNTLTIHELKNLRPDIMLYDLIN